MMKINVIASSSKGNAITVSDGSSMLLLDAGIAYSRLSKAVGLTGVEAVLISHEHMDHSRAVTRLVRRGVPVMMSKGTAGKLYIEHHMYWPVGHLKQVETDNWHILPFDVNHDAAEPLGFLVESKNTGEKAVYIVDSAIVAYDFSGITHWIIEANYDEQLLAESDHEEWLKDRIRRSHFSIDSLKTFLGSSDLSKTKEIHLVHLSDSNSDEKRFIDEIQKLTGVPVYV